VGREEQQIHVRSGPGRCAYCHDSVPERERVACAACLAVHHADCWEGRCASCRADKDPLRAGAGPTPGGAPPRPEPRRERRPRYRERPRYEPRPVAEPARERDPDVAPGLLAMLLLGKKGRKLHKVYRLLTGAGLAEKLAGKLGRKAAKAVFVLVALAVAFAIVAAILLVLLVVAAMFA